MKKLLAILLAVMFVFAFSAIAEGTMSYSDYAAAATDDEVNVNCYVQAKTNYYDGKTTIYAADQDGAYFIYDIPVTQEVFDALVPGTEINVDGYKSEWSGEYEIVDAEVSVVDGGDTYIAEPIDVTDMLSSDDLISYQNRKVSFNGMTVEPSTDADGNEAAFLYNWDGSGEEGSDIYFNVSKDGQTYSFLVRARIEGNGADSDTYKAAQALEIGQTVDLEGYLYWYEGVNPHITYISVVA